MATLDATIGGTAANAYCTVARADEYWSTRLYSDAWDEAGDEDKAKAIMMATRMLNQWFDWFGIMTALDQALPWPRTGVLKPYVSDVPQTTGVENFWQEPFAVMVGVHEIPVLIIEATAELAGQLLVSDRSADSATETQGLRSLTVPGAALVFKDSVLAKPIPDTVMSMASHLGRPRARSGSGAVQLYRG